MRNTRTEQFLDASYDRHRGLLGTDKQETFGESMDETLKSVHPEIHQAAKTGGVKHTRDEENIPKMLDFLDDCWPDDDKVTDDSGNVADTSASIS